MDNNINRLQDLLLEQNIELPTPAFLVPLVGEKLNLELPDLPTPIEQIVGEKYNANLHLIVAIYPSGKTHFLDDYQGLRWAKQMKSLIYLVTRVDWQGIAAFMDHYKLNTPISDQAKAYGSISSSQVTEREGHFVKNVSDALEDHDYDSEEAIWKGILEWFEILHDGTPFNYNFVIQNLEPLIQAYVPPEQ